MSAEAALTRLAESSSEAVVGILEMFAPGQVEAGEGERHVRVKYGVDEPPGVQNFSS